MAELEQVVELSLSTDLEVIADNVEVRWWPHVFRVILDQLRCFEVDIKLNKIINFSVSVIRLTLLNLVKNT